MWETVVPATGQRRRITKFGAIGHHPSQQPAEGGSTTPSGPRLPFEYRAKVATGTYPTTWTRVPEFTGTEYAFRVRAVRDLTIPTEESRC